MVQLRLHLLLLLALEDILAQQENTTTSATELTTTSTTASTTISVVDIGTQLPARRQLENGLGIVLEGRRKGDSKSKNKKSRSTSSSSGSKEKKDSNEKSKGSSDDISLDISDDLSSSTDTGEPKAKKYERKSSAERKGWRKWHRKCHPCPEDMAMKWKDQKIKWICGAYQRAQRSFKSLCMMHYRNCQDGTMFTKIHDHRCKDDNERAGEPHGDHFFYTYNAVVSGESSSSVTSSSELTSDTHSALYNYHEY